MFDPPPLLAGGVTPSLSSRHRRQLGAQADVKGVSAPGRYLHKRGTILAGNLTDQVRNIAKVNHGGGQRRPSQDDHRRRARARSGG